MRPWGKVPRWWLGDAGITCSLPAMRERFVASPWSLRSLWRDLGEPGPAGSGGWRGPGPGDAVLPGAGEGDAVPALNIGVGIVSF